MGGVELSFNARKGVVQNILYSNFDTRPLFVQFKESFSTTIKGFICHRFKNLEAYLTTGIKVKYKKYRSFLRMATPLDYDVAYELDYTRKYHFTPMIGFGGNLYLCDSWFIRGEYNFEFPCKKSMGTKQLGASIDNPESIPYTGCKAIKYHSHNIRFGIGRMF